MYDERIVAPMRQELTRVGFEETKTPSEVDATPFYSPFYGTHYQNRVYALRGADGPHLRATVAAQGIDYLFMRRGSALDRLARRDFPQGRTIFADPRIRVYQLGQLG